MITNNLKNINAIMYIYLIEDCEVFKYSFCIDGKAHNINLSNKGLYCVHLGLFSSLEYEDNHLIRITIKSQNKKIKEFIKNYEIVRLLIGETHKLVYDKPYLYEDLAEFNAVNARLSFRRLLDLTYVYQDTSDETVLKDITYGLEFLFSNWYQGTTNYTGNWWDYEIGIPKIICEIMFILYDQLEPKFIYKATNIMNFYLPNPLYLFYRRNYPNIKREVASYANLADNIYICTLKSLLQEDFGALKKYFKLIKRTLRIVTNKDGFYKDGSFIQHFNIPYNASYGEVLINALSKILEIYHTLGFDCSNYLLDLEQQIKESYEPFLYQGEALDCVRGRAASRKKMNSRYSAITIVKAMERINKLSPSTYLSDLIIRETAGTGKYSLDVKAFNYIDTYLKRTKDYLISISANSRYIANYESILGENTAGYYRSNFMMTLLNTTHQKDYYLLANPFYLMGSTNSFNKLAPNLVKRNDLTAGVVLDGLLVVGYHQKNDVTGYFSKMVLDESILCLGSQIESKEKYITTIYNDTYQKPTIKENEIILGDIKIVTKNEVSLLETVEKHSYQEINKYEDDTMFEGEFLIAFIDNPQKYEYQFYPKFSESEDYKVLDLTDIHLVSFMNKLLICKFTKKLYTFEGLTLEGKMVLILCYYEDEIIIRLSTGRREKQIINISLQGYKVKECDLNYSDASFEIHDELEHTIVFRRYYD